jgi:hypothetical protein
LPRALLRLKASCARRTSLGLAGLEAIGYCKLKSKDREAKTKKLVWTVCDPERITVLSELSARKMSAASWFSIPTKPTMHGLLKAQPLTSRRIKDINPKDVS